MGDREPEANKNPRNPAGFEGELGGECIRPQPDLPFEQRHPELADYQPDLTGKIEGDQGLI